jgi:hypothetical protein
MLGRNLCDTCGSSVASLRRASCQRWVRRFRIVGMTFEKAVGVFCFLLAVLAAQEPVTLTVQGTDGRSVTLTAADLAQLPQKHVETLDHGSPATFDGVLLTDVLAKVELPTGEKAHGKAASYYLLVEAKDGYRAVYAWAEVDSSFMDKAVYLATKRDGKPLSEKAGPFQLVAPGEKKGARWVRQVTALRLKQAN